MLRIENLDNSLFCHKIYISIYATEESQAPIANKTTKEQTRKPVVVNKQELLSSEKRNACSLTCQPKQKVKGNMSLKLLLLLKLNKFSVPKLRY